MSDSAEHILTLLTGIVFLYAEVHFRILGLFSRYFKREPEIVADVPGRIDPGQSLPVLLLVKDSHRYSVFLKSILVSVRGENRFNFKKKISVEKHVEQKWWWRVHSIPLPDSCFGHLEVAVEIRYIAAGEERCTTSDNYALTSKAPLNVYADNEPLPKEPGCYFGDLHVHSNLTEDQVEFGAPLEATRLLARSMGLHFFAATDHSYDLDDTIDSYLLNDPQRPKWQQLWEQVRHLNGDGEEFVVIPGEELSAGNVRGRIVHFLILNNREFLAGSGDSAENWPRTRPELSVKEALAAVEDNALTFAAHPETKTPFLQWLLIRRGRWQLSDYRLPGLTGLQAWNGEKNHGFYAGIDRWVRLLLEGHRPVLVGGNDAHGNFSTFRQIKLPHFFMIEKQSHLFGRVRTGVFIPDKIDLDSLITAIKRGRCIVTDGPFADLKIRNPKVEAAIGDVYPSRQGIVEIKVLSSACFGEIEQVTLFVGDIDRKKETRRISFQIQAGSYSFTVEKFLGDLPRGYLRLEVSTSLGSRCLTNPLFLES